MPRVVLEYPSVAASYQRVEPIAKQERQEDSEKKEQDKRPVGRPKKCL